MTSFERTEVVLRIRELKVYFPLRKGFFHRGPIPTVKAVDGVSLEVGAGEILGLVGESGCGKSSLGRAILRLVEPTYGSVEIHGQDFLKLSGAKLRQARRHAQMVFQDPYASLDPRMTVFNILAEPLHVHESLSHTALNKRVLSTLDRVGLSTKSSRKYPHEFSGGQRQRIAIARALILNPKLIIADEPVSSLDVSVQAQILNLLKDIQSELKLAMIFISHNLAVVRYISDRIAVMYLGKIVETARCDDLYRGPLHPYTQALVSAVPIPDPIIERTRRRIPVTGEIPSRINPPSGCAFHTRCPIVKEHCKIAPPPLDPAKLPTWRVACFEAERY